MYKFILLFFMVAASCGTQKDANTTQTNSNNPSIEEGAKSIALGETIEMGNMVIQFKEVLEDSRCPIGVQCVWEGRVRTVVAVSGDGMTTLEKEIIFGKTKPGEPTSKVIGTTQNLTITAISISPEKTKGMVTTNVVYKMLVRLSKE